MENLIRKRSDILSCPRFEETPEGLDIDIGAGDKEEAAHKFSNGDNVEVMEGELQNLQGRVIAVDGSKITIMPKHEDLKDPLDFQAHELRKYFRQVRGTIGTHIQCCGAGPFLTGYGIFFTGSGSFIK